MIGSVWGGATHEHWDYKDVDNWKEVYPDCGADDESPINIDSANLKKHECVAQFDWNIDYDQHTFKVINNAHSLQLVMIIQSFVFMYKQILFYLRMF